MGVQDRYGARRTLKLLVVESKGAHCLPATAGHQGIEDALMAPCQGPELRRQGESHKKILGRHMFLELTFQPLLALKSMLAVLLTAILKITGL